MVANWPFLFSEGRIFGDDVPKQLPVVCRDGWLDGPPPWLVSGSQPLIADVWIGPDLETLQEDEYLTSEWRHAHSS